MKVINKIALRVTQVGAALSLMWYTELVGNTPGNGLFNTFQYYLMEYAAGFLGFLLLLYALVGLLIDIGGYLKEMFQERRSHNH